jgi:hypothetical protein
MRRSQRPSGRLLVWIVSQVYGGKPREERHSIIQGRNLPSYAVPGTPFITALQDVNSSSFTGPSSRSASFGSDWYVLSSVRRRLIGPWVRDGPAMFSTDKDDSGSMLKGWIKLAIY